MKTTIEDDVIKGDVAVQPGILNIMMRLQCEFNLPIRIEVGEHIDELVRVTISTTVDEQIPGWFLNSASIIYQLNEAWPGKEAEAVS